MASGADPLLYGLHRIFDAFGATRPLRLGLAVALALALGWPAEELAKHYGFSMTGNTLHYSLFGVSFLLLFFPLLIRPGPPEPHLELIATIERAAKEAGLSRAQKRMLNRELLEIMIRTNTSLASIDFDKVKEAYGAMQNNKSKVL